MDTQRTRALQTHHESEGKEMSFDLTYVWAILALLMRYWWLFAIALVTIALVLLLPDPEPSPIKRECRRYRPRR